MEPGIKTGEMSKRLSVMWKELTPVRNTWSFDPFSVVIKLPTQEEKHKWMEKARLVKEVFQAKNPDYVSSRPNWMRLYFLTDCPGLQTEAKQPRPPSQERFFEGEVRLARV
jgi:hypothetical protein